VENDVKLRKPKTRSRDIVGAIMKAAFAYYEMTGDMPREMAIAEDQFDELTQELGYTVTRSSIPPKMVEGAAIRSGLDVAKVQKEVAIRINGIYIWRGRRRL
jgi:hypothetical protein